MKAHLIDRPLPEIAAALSLGERGAGELFSVAVERHGSLGDRLDAWQTWDPDAALRRTREAGLEARRGPLGSIPVSVKDLFGLDGHATFAGTALRLSAHWEREGPIVRELRRQGSLLLGKTRMVELAFGGLGTNPHWGTPRNPWDADVHRVPGGSSCGAGVSVQEGSALVALCTDTACSARTPAAWTGCVGLKTTKWRWSTEGMVPLSPTLDSVGIIARTVLDVSFAFTALDAQGAGRGVAEREPGGLTVGVLESGAWAACPDDVGAPVRAAVGELEAAGARVVDVSLPEFDQAYDLYMEGHLVAPECATFLARELPEWRELLHATVGGRLAGTEGVADPRHRDAIERRLALVRSAQQGLRRADVFVLPTVPLTAPTLAEVDAPDDYARLNRMTSRATNPVNVLDLCALTLPCGLDGAGVPVGLQLVARGGEDELLLAAARAAERVLGTAPERIGRPPLLR